MLLIQLCHACSALGLKELLLLLLVCCLGLHTALTGLGHVPNQQQGFLLTLHLTWICLCLLHAAILLCLEGHELGIIIRGNRTTCAKRRVNRVGALEVPMYWRMTWRARCGRHIALTRPISSY